MPTNRRRCPGIVGCNPRWDPEIDAKDIAVTASDGVITLTGFVRSYAAKLAAAATPRP